MKSNLNSYEQIEAKAELRSSFADILDILSITLQNRRFEFTAAADVFKCMTTERQNQLAEWIIEGNLKAGENVMHIIFHALELREIPPNAKDIVNEIILRYINQRRLEETPGTADKVTFRHEFSKEAKLRAQIPESHKEKRTNQRVGLYKEDLSSMLKEEYGFDLETLNSTEISCLINYLVDLKGSDAAFLNIVIKICNITDKKEIYRRLKFFKGSMQNLHERLRLSPITDSVERLEDADGYTIHERRFIEDETFNES